MVSEIDDKNKQRLTPEERQDLRTIYSAGFDDLRSFRDTYYQIIGILSAASVGLALAGIQYRILLTLIPLTLAIISVSSVSYLFWRKNSIKFLAAVERRLKIPSDCAYLSDYDERMVVSVLPLFLKERTVQIVIILSVAAALLVDCALLIFAPP
jgi:hypothetical protein